MANLTLEIDHEDEEDSREKLLRYLRELPADTTIVWGENQATDEAPYCSGWVDVVVPEIMEVTGWNWIWTVEEPSHSQVDDNVIERVILPPNLAIHGIWSNEEHWWTEEIPLSLDEMPPEEFRNRDGYGFRYGWTLQSISNALTIWCNEWVQREDITFSWSSEIIDPMLEEAANISESMKAGDVEGYVIFEDPETGKQVKASPQVMDFLLKNPEVGKEVMTTMKHVLDTELEPVKKSKADSIKEEIENIIAAVVDEDNPTEDQLREAELQVDVLFGIPLELEFSEDQKHVIIGIRDTDVEALGEDIQNIEE